MRKPEGKTAIVTGASTRIGAAICLALALDGAAVVAGYPPDQS
jgi:NAD(P)-dependent dehydrogenase (short-subunit alcohol dehydrogenase family)